MSSIVLTMCFVPFLQMRSRYRAMCAFWTGALLKVPEIKRLNWYMRVDTDSKLECQSNSTYDPFDDVQSRNASCEFILCRLMYNFSWLCDDGIMMPLVSALRASAVCQIMVVSLTVASSLTQMTMWYGLCFRNHTPPPRRHVDNVQMVIIFSTVKSAVATLRRAWPCLLQTTCAGIQTCLHA